jgi:hypothetical protein
MENSYCQTPFPILLTHCKVAVFRARILFHESLYGSDLREWLISPPYGSGSGNEKFFESGIGSGIKSGTKINFRSGFGSELFIVCILHYPSIQTNWAALEGCVW